MTGWTRFTNPLLCRHQEVICRKKPDLKVFRLAEHAKWGDEFPVHLQPWSETDKEKRRETVRIEREIKV